jgi:3-hydroxyacyl-CoA dehydrogenase/enoyl-CoA hydratase/3-hydroxybutyryl-CoA epimerase
VADALLARILPTDRYADFSDCSIVIEAVFESRDIKAAVIAAVEAVLPAAATFASNTSTLPITSLAAHSSRPDRFIGMHFFSPVDRMPLVEVIRGEATSDETLAVALDLVAAMRKTPIVVNDGRGFFTSRCFGAMSNEAAALLEAGTDPLLIERAALAAGMPIAPLALSDIMGADLSLRVDDQARSDLGPAYVETPGIRVRRTLALAYGRKGKASGGGFYDYEPDGSRRIWAGLAAIWPLAADQPAFDDVKKAMLFSQSLEALRALDEGVLHDPVEGDVGSVIGWGFPAYTGGVFSLIDTHGAAHFAGECERLAALFGPRFRPPNGLVSKAQANAAFVEARL